METTTGLATIWIAKALGQLVYQAEDLYSGRFTDDVRHDYEEVVGRLAGRLERRLREYWRLRNGDRQDPRYIQVKDQVKAFAIHAAASRAVPNPLIGTEDWEPTFEYERWSFREHNDGRPQSLVDAVVAIFSGTQMETLFKLAFLLTAELHPTFRGGQRTRSTVEREMFMTGQLVPKVQSLIGRLDADLALRLPRSWRLLGRDVLTDMEQIERLLDAIVGALRSSHPPSLYLGLVLDRAGARIGRFGEWQRFPHPTRWGMLRKIAEARGEVVPTDVLLAELNRNHHAEASSEPHAVVAAIYEIRPTLEKLGLQIKNERSLGYKLCEFNTETKRVPKKRNKKSCRRVRAGVTGLDDEPEQPLDGSAERGRKKYRAVSRRNTAGPAHRS